MPRKKHKRNNESSAEQLRGAWVGFISSTILFLLLGAFLFNWAWWIFIPIAGTLIGAISTTINYFTEDTKLCPSCSARLDKEAQFCRACGTKILNACKHCGEPVKNPKSRYCEQCGKALYENTPLPQNPSVKNAMKKEEVYMYCPACGTKVSEGTPVCPSCGIDL